MHCREHNIKSYKSIQKKVFKLMVVASKQTNQKAKALTSRPMASKPKLPSVSPGSFITDVTPCSTLTSLLSSQVELNRIFIIFQPNGTLQFQIFLLIKRFILFVFSLSSDDHPPYASLVLCTFCSSEVTWYITIFQNLEWSFIRYTALFTFTLCSC